MVALQCGRLVPMCWRPFATSNTGAFDSSTDTCYASAVYACAANNYSSASIASITTVASVRYIFMVHEGRFRGVFPEYQQRSLLWGELLHLRGIHYGS